MGCNMDGSIVVDADGRIQDRVAEVLVVEEYASRVVKLVDLVPEEVLEGVVGLDLMVQLVLVVVELLVLVVVVPLVVVGCLVGNLVCVMGAPRVGLGLASEG